MLPHLGGKILGLKIGNKPTKGGLKRFRAGQQLPVVQAHPQLWHVEMNPGCGIPSCPITLMDRLMSLGKPICPVQPRARINKAGVPGFQSGGTWKGLQGVNLSPNTLWKGSSHSDMGQNIPDGYQVLSTGSDSLSL